jgi:hypothetical protein
MGASLVASALTVWGPKLGRYHAARVALLVMANTALDDDLEPAYWRGPEPIATALGLGGSPRTRDKRVSEALRPLLHVGAIARVSEPAQGRRARYRLHVRPGEAVHNAPAGLRSSAERAPVTGAAPSPVTRPTAPRNGGRPSLVTGDVMNQEEPQGATEDQSPEATSTIRAARPVDGRSEPTHDAADEDEVFVASLEAFARRRRIAS